MRVAGTEGEREEEDSTVFTEPLGCENDGSARSSGAYYPGLRRGADEMPPPPGPGSPRRVRR